MNTRTLWYRKSGRRWGWVDSIMVQRFGPTTMSSRKVSLGFLRIQFDGPSLRQRFEQGTDAGLGDRMPAVLHGPRRVRLELERPGQDLV